jgi:hypothetical protein
VLLSEARSILTDSVLHVGNTSFSDAKQDRAIKAACQRFIRETKCNYQSFSVPIVSGSASLNVQTTIAGFDIQQFMTARIGYSPVLRTSFQAIEREYAEGVVSGQPTKIAFYAANDAILFPTPNANATLTLTARTNLLAWTDGMNTPNTVTLNVPAEWARDIIWWGARGYMLYGLKGHGEAEPSMKMFGELIQTASAYFGSDQSGLTDRNTA